MNIHKNARTTPQSRAMLIRRVLIEGWPIAEVAMSMGISTRTVYKWLARYRDEGAAGLQDRSSAARRHPHALPAAWIALIRLLRQAKLVAAEIAARLPLARSTVNAVLARIGLGRLRYLVPPEPVQRYEWQRPGELVHMDIKKLGRFTRPGHRVTGHRHTPSAGGGWEYAHVAIDDCSRLAYVEILPDQKRYTTLLVARRACVPAPWHPHSTRAHRQRRRLSLATVSQSLSLARDCHQTHATLSPANQRQSGALHPNAAA